MPRALPALSIIATLLLPTQILGESPPPAEQRSRALLKKLLGSERKPERWTEVFRSRHLPFIRAFRSPGPLPQVVILELNQEQELGRVGEAEISTMLKRGNRRKRSCSSKALSKQVARLYLLVHSQPFAPQDVRISIKRRRGGLQMTGTYKRSIPWESAKGKDSVARLRIEERQIVMRLSKTCRFQAVSAKLLKATYAAQ